MKLSGIARAMALAVVSGLFLQTAAAADTNSWWDIDFEAYATGSSFTNADPVYYGVRWEADAEDGTSVITNVVDGATTDNYLSLNTEGTDLICTPTNSPAGAVSSVTIIDSDVKFVGSEVAPTDFGETNIQTAVYLKHLVDLEGNTTGRVLCAWATTGSGNGWVEFTDTNAVPVEIDETTRVHLKITVDYSKEQPLLAIAVNDVDFVTREASEPTAVIANYGAFSSTKKLSSVHFRGTGEVDNFKAAYTTAGGGVVDEDVFYQVYASNKVDSAFTSIEGDALAALVDPVACSLVSSSEDPVTTIQNTENLAGAYVYTNETDYIEFTCSSTTEGLVWTPTSEIVDFMDTEIYIKGTMVSGPSAEEPVKIVLFYGGMPSGGGAVTINDFSIGSSTGENTAIGFTDTEQGEFFKVTIPASQAGVSYIPVVSGDVSADNASYQPVEGVEAQVGNGSDLTFLIPATDDILFVKIKASTAE